MLLKISHRKANIDDLPKLIDLLLDDELGAMRESHSDEIDKRYIEAFHKIDRDQNQYLMVVENGTDIIGNCHLTIMPSLTFMGSTRMQIEAVRVAAKYRGESIGTWMFEQAILYGRQHGASIIQLTTNKKRTSAKRLYEKLGFEASHDGMKLYL